MQNCNQHSLKKSRVWQQWSLSFTTSLRLLWEKIDNVKNWLLDQIGYDEGIVFQCVHNNDLAMVVIQEIKIDQSQYLFMTASEYQGNYTNTCYYKTLVK